MAITIEMSNWPETSKYSKKSVFLPIPDDIEILNWADQTIHRLGGVKGLSDGEKGWILPNNQEDNFYDQYKLFRENRDAQNQRVRRSRNPDKKHKRSRVFVRASEQKSLLEENKRGTEKKLNSSKPVSYINWEAPTMSDETLSDNENDEKSEDEKSEDEKSEDEKSEDEKSESDEESSDDELIQAVLARKMKSESSGKLIDIESINDSDEEDNVSHSRRFRHIYSVLENIRSRLLALERGRQAPPDPPEQNDK